MRSIRTCSHIKSNGVRCGSPALRHHTMCYFHYQWQRREQRRVRLGGPVGMNKNTGVELPILEGPESIMIAIMEIQHALLDNRITHKTATALLYSIQLALQVKLPFASLSNRFDSVTACPELDFDLELERAKGQRPDAKVCSSCRQAPTCTSPRTCPQKPALLSPQTSLQPSALPTPPSSRPERAVVARGVEGPASPLDSHEPCHPERSTAVSCGAEGPFVSSPEATTREKQPAFGITIQASSAPERSPAPFGHAPVSTKAKEFLWEFSACRIY